MPEPLSQDVFGTGFAQDANTITIQKSALPGLTPSVNNSAESLLVGILLKAQALLTQTNFDTNLDQSVYLTPGFSSFTNRGPDNASYRVDQITVNLVKPDTGSIIDPDDY